MNASLGLKHRVLIVSFRYPTLLIDADIRLWDGPMGRSPSQSLRQTSAHNLPIPEGQHQSPLAEVCFWFWQLSHEGLGLKKRRPMSCEFGISSLESKFTKLWLLSRRSISQRNWRWYQENAAWEPYCHIFFIIHTESTIAIHDILVQPPSTFPYLLQNLRLHVTNSSSIIEEKLSPWR